MKRSGVVSGILLSLAVASAGRLPSPAAAASAPPVPAVEDGALGEVRGGFVAEGGVTVSFGIEQSTYVNGLLQSRNAFRVDDVGEAMRGAHAGRANAEAPGRGVPGKTEEPDGMGAWRSGVFTLIRNRLDGQAIRSVTRVEATVSGLPFYRSTGLSESLSRAVIDAIR